MRPVEWLAHGNTAMAAIIIANIWKGVPFNMILLATALTTVPQDIYESASIDGATRIQRFFYITVPLLRPRLAYSLVKQKFDADDIHQEVFIRYLRKKPIFQNQENEKAWFLRVTINCCKNHWKSAWMRKITAVSRQRSS